MTPHEENLLKMKFQDVRTEVLEVFLRRSADQFKYSLENNVAPNGTMSPGDAVFHALIEGVNGILWQLDQGDIESRVRVAKEILTSVNAHEEAKLLPEY